MNKHITSLMKETISTIKMKTETKGSHPLKIDINNLLYCIKHIEQLTPKILEYVYLMKLLILIKHKYKYNISMNFIDNFKLRTIIEESITSLKFLDLVKPQDDISSELAGF